MRNDGDGGVVLATSYLRCSIGITCRSHCHSCCRLRTRSHSYRQHNRNHHRYHSFHRRNRRHSDFRHHWP